MLSNVLIFITNCKKNLPMFLIAFRFISTALMLETILMFINLSMKMKMRSICLNTFVPQVFLRKKVCFQKKHDLAHKYFLNIDEDLPFTHNVLQMKLITTFHLKKLTINSMETRRLKNFKNFLLNMIWLLKVGVILNSGQIKHLPGLILTFSLLFFLQKNLKSIFQVKNVEKF